MKRRTVILLMLAISAGFHVRGAHIAGGELQYEYIGPGSGNTDRYRLTMRLFRECSSTGPQLVNEIVNVGAYSSSTLVLQSSVILYLVSGINEIRLQENAIPCLVGSPNVCYQVAIYTNEIELPPLPEGYTLAWARCCRANALMNAPGQLGATYVSKIPGKNILPTGYNSSPQFVVKDTALVCGDSDFILDFGASDFDGDSLSYEFCEAYVGGSTSNQTAPPPGMLNLQPVPYASGFSGNQPLGSGVTINPRTGIISGIAPSEPGRYVVNVCVTEWRNGVPISQHRKDFILKVGDCNIIAAKLNEQYVSCDSFTRVFRNEVNSSEIKSYFWDFGLAGSNDTSNLPQPSFTFPDTGIYKIMLIINRNEECGDTAYSVVRVFPGFSPKFSFTGSCYQTPFQFNDATTANYGQVNNWKWDFGVVSSTTDTSAQKSPAFQYESLGSYNVRLTVGSNKGCSGIAEKTAVVSDKPYLRLPFSDTLICSRDSLQLLAEGIGEFKWTPNSNIINATSANPVVYPKDTTMYFVELNEKGCLARDTIVVNVVDAITVSVQADTAICKTDSIRLRVNSPALRYTWFPSTGLSRSDVAEPMAAPDTLTRYRLLATVGSCTAMDSVVVRVSPYPYVMAGMDTSICFGDKLQLHASVQCNSFHWAASSNLVNTNTLHPLAVPAKTTAYILTATGNQECPKSLHDTVIVTVIPQVKAFAGNDTTITDNQPLQLHATGGRQYQWSPAMFLSNPSIPDPVVDFSGNVDSMTYTLTVSTEDGCSGEDQVKIVVFKTGPQIFVPDAFTPNHDGRNDLLYPVIVGMKQLNFFRVYNRFGQLLFSTSEAGKGWDGRLSGKEQATGTYVYMAQAVNYKGEAVFKKGTVVLIR